MQVAAEAEAENESITDSVPPACQRRRTGRVGHWVPILVLLSGLGPYLTGFGLRTDHLFVYSLAVGAPVLLLLGRRTLLRSRWVQSATLAFAILVIWCSASTVLSDGWSAATSRFAIANFESFFQPLGILLVIGAYVGWPSDWRLAELLQRTCGVLVLALAANTVLMLVHVTTGESWFFEPFLPARNPLMDGENTWDRALELGRYTGIFGSPFEAGLVYSLGLLTWVYLERVSSRISVPRVLCVILLLAGPLLSVSKIAILGGIPLAVAYYLWPERGQWGRLPVRTGVLLTLMVTVASVIWGLSAQWAGADRLARLLALDSDAGALSLITAGRVGSGESVGTIRPHIDLVMENAPIWGFGYGQKVIVDNAFLQVLVAGGLVGLLLYSAALFFIAMANRRRANSQPERLLLLFSFVFVLLASFGGPVLTKNRFSTAYWSIFALAAAIGTRSHPRPSESVL